MIKEQQSFLNEYIPFQLGQKDTGYTIPVPNLGFVISRATTGSSEDIANANGNIDVRGFSRNFLSGRELQLDIQVKTEVAASHIEYLERLAYNVNRDIIFFRKFDNRGNVRFFYNYYKIQEGIAVSENDKTKSKKVSLTIYLYYPFFFECEYERLYVLDKSLGGSVSTYGSSNNVYGSNANVYGSITSNSNYAALYTTLTKKEKEDFFINCNITKKLSYTDTFIRLDTIDVSTENDYVASLNNNLLTGFAVDTLDLQTSYDSFINTVYLPYSFAQNEWIEMFVPATKSSFRFRWLDSVASPEIMLHSGFNTAYDYSSGERIDRTKYSFVSSKDGLRDTTLSFQGLVSPPSEYFLNTNNIFMQKSTSGNITNLRIKNLKLFI